MANNRYGPRGGWGGGRDERGDYGYADRERSHRAGDWGGGQDRDEDRGFFERAGDEIRSWFGGDEDEDDRTGRFGSSRRDYGRDQERGDTGFGRQGERDYGRHYDRMSQEHGGSRGRVQSWGEANRGLSLIHI